MDEKIYSRNNLRLSKVLEKFSSQTSFPKRKDPKKQKRRRRLAYMIIILIIAFSFAYFVLQAGAPAYYLQVTYIIFSLIILVLRQIALNRIVKFNNWNLIRKSYIPCIYVVILFTLVFTIKGIVVPFMLMIISIVYLLILYFTIALTKEERLFVINRIKGLIKK